MNSCTVDLIATDPPFNKGRDFHATPDSLAKGASFQDRWSWEKDVHQEWVDQITDDHPNVINVIQSSRSSYGDDMGAFLCFMGVRLLAMKRVLKDTGSIYLHCDPTASHYLKELMDAVFGKENFRNEIIWCYRKWTNKTDGFQKNHDIIFRYSKSDVFTYNTLFDDNAPQHKKWERGWDVNRVEKGIRQLIVYDKIKAKDKIKSGKYDRIIYRDTKKQGVNLGDWWEIPIINSQAVERTGYPTQKPLVLYERIIKASSNEDDIVLDPFAGCATTCVAAERLKRQWVGIDIWDKVKEVIIDRVEKEGLVAIGRDQKKIRQMRLFEENLIYTTEIPKRTDDGQTASQFLKTKKRILEPQDKKMSRAEMVAYLLEQKGYKCQGCDRIFDDSRYLELDHNTPRADGGINHISNRILLCSPCNKLKKHYYTLSGLRRENVRHGYMAG